jgi:hypothetical protein
MSDTVKKDFILNLCHEYKTFSNYSKDFIANHICSHFLLYKNISQIKKNMEILFKSENNLISLMNYFRLYVYYNRIN